MFNLKKSNYILPKIILNLFLKKKFKNNNFILYKNIKNNLFNFLLFFSKNIRNKKLNFIIYEWIKYNIKLEKNLNEVKFFLKKNQLFLKKINLKKNKFNLNYLLSIKTYKGLNLKNWVNSSVRYCSYYFKGYDFFSMNLSYSIFTLKKIFLILSVLGSNGLPILFINKYYNDLKSKSMQKIVKQCYQSCIHGWIPGSLTNFKRISRYGLSSFYSLKKKKLWNRNALFLIKNKLNYLYLKININNLILFFIKNIKKKYNNIILIKSFLKKIKLNILFYFLILNFFIFLKKIKKKNKTILLYLNKKKFKRRIYIKKKKNIIFLNNFLFKGLHKKKKNIFILKKKKKLYFIKIFIFKKNIRALKKKYKKSSKYFKYKKTKILKKKKF